MGRGVRAWTSVQCGSSILKLIEGINSNVAHRLLAMNIDKARRLTSVLNRSPLMASLSVAVLLLCLWHVPVSIPYLMVALVFGLGFAFVVFLSPLKAHFDLLLMPFTFLIILLEIIARYKFLGGLSQIGSGWRVSFQFFSLVYASIFGVAWMLRHRIMTSLLVSDAQQITGSERG